MSDAYIRAVVEARASDDALAAQLRVLTTSAGFPGEFRPLIRDAGLIHMHKVGATAHAKKAEAAGVDVVIASGYEMGGHTHVSPMHTFVLVPNVTEAVSVPVVLSGGARDGRTLAAALALGADGVAMGTRFIASEENTDWHPAYAERILAAREGDDVVFPAVYGPARGLRNAGVERLFEILDRGELQGDELNRWKDEALIRAQSDGDVEAGHHAGRAGGVGDRRHRAGRGVRAAHGRGGRRDPVPARGGDHPGAGLSPEVAQPSQRPGIVLLGGDLATVASVSRRAEQAGFSSVWTTEFYERSAPVSLAVMAQSTTEATIGSAIAYAVGRSPLVLAAEARDIDELSGGRLILGLGTGTRTMQRDWHGVDPEAPAVRVEELVPLLRRFWAWTSRASTTRGASTGCTCAPRSRCGRRCDRPFPCTWPA